MRNETNNPPPPPQKKKGRGGKEEKKKKKSRKTKTKTPEDKHRTIPYLLSSSLFLLQLLLGLLLPDRRLGLHLWTLTASFGLDLLCLSLQLLLFRLHLLRLCLSLHLLCISLRLLCLTFFHLFVEKNPEHASEMKLLPQPSCNCNSNQKHCASNPGTVPDVFQTGVRSAR